MAFDGGCMLVGLLGMPPETRAACIADTLALAVD
jgi:hypothetical protein